MGLAAKIAELLKQAQLQIGGFVLGLAPRA
jgi:hypothetical protein